MAKEVNGLFRNRRAIGLNDIVNVQSRKMRILSA